MWGWGNSDGGKGSSKGWGGSSWGGGDSWGGKGHDMKGMLKGMMGMVKPLGRGKGKTKGGKQGDPKVVFVGGVKGDPTEEEVRSIFGMYGAIEEVKLMKYEDGRLKGYFFVHFADAETANTCVQNASLIELGGQKVDIKMADGGSGTKPGDWTCPMCYDNVFAKRDTCNRCGYYGGYWGAGDGFGKGGNLRKLPGDWTCEACGDNVFAKKANCNKCGAPKPGGAITPY
eukprot:TRINITY_DN126404_c0_g1_i1.p1 TRINITY_DN126404_c0_g1~~TRINITY_DN126404_c0_g1_i1.p1  ORF type:complete len:228 (+),score=52.05 TRINITY_DN126404_c0_g1_i1:81-764(+)